MAKLDIHTYSKIQVNDYNGTLRDVRVNKIVCEQENVPDVSKTVSVFSKFSAKKNFNVAYKNNTNGIER